METEEPNELHAGQALICFFLVLFRSLPATCTNPTAIQTVCEHSKHSTEDGFVLTATGAEAGGVVIHV